MSRYWSKLLCSKGDGSLLVQISGGIGVSLTNNCWRRTTRVRGLSRGVVSVILCLAVLVQYQCVTDGRTDIR